MLCPAWYSQVQNLWRRRTSADIVDSQLANDNQVPGLEGASVCAGVLGLPRHDGGAFALHGGMAALAIRAISPIPFTNAVMHFEKGGLRYCTSVECVRVRTRVGDLILDLPGAAVPNTMHAINYLGRNGARPVGSG